MGHRTVRVDAQTARTHPGSGHFLVHIRVTAGVFAIILQKSLFVLQ